MQQRRSDDGRQCVYAWSGHEIQSQVFGSEKNEKKEVQRELLAHQEEILEEKMVVKKLLRAGMVPARTW